MSYLFDLLFGLFAWYCIATVVGVVLVRTWVSVYLAYEARFDVEYLDRDVVLRIQENLASHGFCALIGVCAAIGGFLGLFVFHSVWNAKLALLLGMAIGAIIGAWLLADRFFLWKEHWAVRATKKNRDHARLLNS